MYGGAAWRTVEVIEAVEAGLGKPVFTAHQVSARAALARLGIPGKASSGSLFS